MKITPKFFARKLPPMIDGEVVIHLMSDSKTVRMFVRHDDSDKENPQRVCVEMSRYEVQRLIDQLQHNLNSIKSTAE